MFPRIFFIFFLVLSPSFGSESEGPSETECRPYIEKALQREGVTQEPALPPDDVGEPPHLDEAIDGSKEDATSGEEPAGSAENQQESVEDASEEAGVLPESASAETSAEELFQESSEAKSEDALESSGEPPAPESTENIESAEIESAVGSDEIISTEAVESLEEAVPEASGEDAAPSSEETVEATSAEAPESQEATNSEETGAEVIGETESSGEQPAENDSGEQSVEVSTESLEQDVKPEEIQAQSQESEPAASEEPGSGETPSVEVQSSEEASAPQPEPTESGAAAAEPETVVADNLSPPTEEPLSQESEVATSETASAEEPAPAQDSASAEESTEITSNESEIKDSVETPSAEQPAEEPAPSVAAPAEPEAVPAENEPAPTAEAEVATPVEEGLEPKTEEGSLEEATDEQPITTSEGESDPGLPEEDLIMPIEIPSNLRTREHMTQILKLGLDADDKEKLLAKTMDNTLRELKKLYDVAIKPLEILYKYRDLSNRHFGDPEIFSKPLVLFMGPWSGGKSTIINYLLENEFKKTALRSGAEPSPAYFNIVMWGENEEILDGTQLAADWTFSGLQKFGQGLLDRLRGLKLNHPLLQKVNIVEIPGILEIRKQVERMFPFNDACQWFIDRADIIFLVYDPSKLDVGPETEAILDQLKGREMQTRIVLNKADQVKPEELMRVQSTLIWNISPLMSSTEPPVMYSTSLWSLPYEVGAPARLLYAQECSFLQDLREAIDKRVENKIASARRFAVRVRNHAKMVDCYLTTYYNHKSFFGNKKKVSDDIIEHPQNYHIYEGLSTLTNISRYDLPDPDVYKDFFRLNPVYEFQQLAATCTYFRGCPINRLDVAIAYDLPDLIGKYKKSVEQLLNSRK